MELLNNPDVIYMLLAGGLVFLILGLAAPGTGFLEAITLIILGAAGWGIIIYRFPINLWALLLIFTGAVFFFFSVRRGRTLLLLAISCAAVTIGSVYLFRSEQGLHPAVSPWLALTVSVLSAGLFWIIGRRASEAFRIQPTHNLENLLGEIGEAKTPIFRQGSIQVKGELWSARSLEPIEQGKRVEVIGRDGFILDVKPFDERTTRKDI
jgi:membrane-bound serine protease (ClpP class)